jgi:hypothetical protein
MGSMRSMRSMRWDWYEATIRGTSMRSPSGETDRLRPREAVVT